MREKLKHLTVEALLAAYPHAADFLSLLPVTPPQDELVLVFLAGMEEEVLQDISLGKEELLERFFAFMEQMEGLKKNEEQVRSITILGGFDKKGGKETIDLTINAGEIICIVGPTGSGKSRLLADIEWLAQRDTPTGRQILINGQVPEVSRRFSVQRKFVAQLSQNMNFVMDLTVEEFLRMHAESRMHPDIEEIVGKVIGQANALAGEAFTGETPVTSLSGGQSRALMIADTAYLSASPVVLIDEIENAGIDRQKAIKLLVDKQKIVFMATHDPILALMGDKRLVIGSGSIRQVIETSATEKRNLITLDRLDRQLNVIRNTLRCGGTIDTLPDNLGNC